MSQRIEITKPASATPRTERPDPAWIRGKCPQCDEVLVSHLHYVKGEGYFIRWECWASIGESPTCDYKKVL